MINISYIKNYCKYKNIFKYKSKSKVLDLQIPPAKRAEYKYFSPVSTGKRRVGWVAQ